MNRVLTIPFLSASSSPPSTCLALLSSLRIPLSLSSSWVGVLQVGVGVEVPNWVGLYTIHTDIRIGPK